MAVVKWVASETEWAALVIVWDVVVVRGCLDYG